jgi:ADP-ribosylglycohydrolase
MPYGSFGNGAAMRISPVAWSYCRIAPLIDEYYPTLLMAVEAATVPTHGHPESLRGAKAVSMAICLAYNGEWGQKQSKEYIGRVIAHDYGYDLNKSLAEIRPTYQFDSSCAGTVPVAIRAFLESHDFVSAIQNAISVGGDSDTIAAITGSIAEVYYGDIPYELKAFARSKLPDDIQEALGMKS